MEYMESMMQNQYDAQNQLIMELDETRMERDQLKAERDALAAQNESFKKAIKAIENDLIECSYDDESGYFVGIDSISDACDLANYATPQQCLRDVKDEAIQAGLDALGAPVTKFGNKSDDFVAGFNFCAVLLQQHADKVRKGGAE